jgi:glyoxylase-like metal-dependent hydrolase (beta-lactamase superfamily II)
VDIGRRIHRRTFIAELGRGVFAIAAVGVAGCLPSAGTVRPSGASPSATGGVSPSPTSSHSDGPSTGPAGTPDASAATPGAALGELRWERVDLASVSAYVLVRSGEVAIVDTGVSGSADEIEAALSGLGLGWSAVRHVILTHKHADHVGSAADVLAKATDATGYAGAEDVPSITVPRPLVAVGDGDRVFDLDVVSTPGHTAGSISVVDPVAGVLVAGDALQTWGSRPIAPPAGFTADMGLARRSIAKLAGLSFETLLVGHGDPIETGASALVVELAKAG